MYSLYIDDIRNPKTHFDFIARSCSEAKQIIIEHDLPVFISFDHDLGNDEDGTGYDFLKWLIEYIQDNKLKFPNEFDYTVHSANPVGKANIIQYFNCYFNCFKSE